MTGADANVFGLVCFKLASRPPMIEPGLTSSLSAHRGRPANSRLCRARGGLQHADGRGGGGHPTQQLLAHRPGPTVPGHGAPADRLAGQLAGPSGAFRMSSHRASEDVD